MWPPFYCFGTPIWPPWRHVKTLGHFRVRASLHGGGGPQIGEVTCGRSPRLSCKCDQIKTRDYMDRRVTSPTWGSPPLCKQALIVILWSWSFLWTVLHHGPRFERKKCLGLVLTRLGCLLSTLLDKTYHVIISPDLTPLLPLWAWNIVKK